MTFGWKFLLPVALLNIFLTATLQAFGVIDSVNDFLRALLAGLG
jgi:NADH:ubiquinone oxidoreductase subunit H